MPPWPHGVLQESTLGIRQLTILMRSKKFFFQACSTVRVSLPVFRGCGLRFRVSLLIYDVPLSTFVWVGSVPERHSRSKRNGFNGQGVEVRGRTTTGTRQALGVDCEGVVACFRGLAFRVQGSGLRVQSSGFRVQVSGFRVQGLGHMVSGFGCRVRVSGFGPGIWDCGFRRGGGL